MILKQLNNEITIRKNLFGDWYKYKGGLSMINNADIRYKLVPNGYGGYTLVFDIQAMLESEKLRERKDKVEEVK